MVALISTPGPYAFADAVDAVDAGLLTMVFSDNVPVEQEVALKQRAAETGVLVMGPTAAPRSSAAWASASPTWSVPARSASSPPPAPARST